MSSVQPPVPQIRDTLIVGADSFHINTGPSLPTRHLGVRQTLVSEFTQLDELCSTPMCKRGYRATWLVRDRQLLLSELIGRYRLTCGGPVIINGYNDVIRGQRYDTRNTNKRLYSGIDTHEFIFNAGKLVNVSELDVEIAPSISLSA